MKMDCTLRCRPLYNEGTAGKDDEKKMCRTQRWKKVLTYPGKNMPKLLPYPGP